MTAAQPGAPPADGALTGGCLCGAVRYRITLPLVGRVSHCHCTMCRRAAGAVAVTWLTVRRAAFRLTGRPLTVHRSSDHGERGFCGVCGSPVTFWTRQDSDLIDVTVGTLDHPDALPAEEHIWTGSRLPWLHLDTHLPDRPADTDGGA